MENTVVKVKPNGGLQHERTQKTFIHLLADHSQGLTSSTQFKLESRYLFNQKLTPSPLKITHLYSKIFYCDVYINRLIVTTNGFEFHLYDLLEEAPDHPIVGSWKPKETTANYSIGLPCTTWGPDTSFILVSGCGHSLSILDTQTLQTVEAINLDEPSRTNSTTMGHNMSPFNKEIIAVASTNGTVPLVDLRTGNIETVVGKDVADVSSVAWSQFHNDTLVIASQLSKRIEVWDIRARKQYCSFTDFMFVSLPDLQFISNTQLAVYKDSCLDIIDLLKNEVEISFNVSRNSSKFRRKNKFALDSINSPTLLYFPLRELIGVLDLRRQKVIKNYTCNLFPIDLLLFNYSLKEMYSFSDDEVLSWTVG